MSALDSVKSYLEKDARCIAKEENQRLYIYMRSQEKEPGNGRGVFAIISEDAPGKLSITASAVKGGKTLRSSGTFGVDEAKGFLSGMSVSKLAEHDKAYRAAREKERQA
jgi:hypothetical protein